MTRYKKKSDVRFRTVGDETVVLRQQEAEVLVLNEVGGRLLEITGTDRESGHSEDEIVASLLGEFEVEEPELRRDVQVFLAEMIERGILEVAR